MFKQLFATKSLETLHAEAAGENRLRRILGPINLTSLGVGAIIGAGIFVMTGRSAAIDAGPAILLSFVVAGIGCLFAALCYAEFSALAPVAGSAYTYAYATLGELFAWIIGWDLILEYAMACACVAAAWSKYLNELLYVLFSWKVPEYLCNDPFSTPGAWFNLPAFFITFLVTVILVIGIRESATSNAVLVAVKVGVVLFVIVVGVFFVNPSNWYAKENVANRIFTEDVKTIPDLAAKAVKEEAMPTEEADKRIDQIVEHVRTLYDEKGAIPADAAAAKQFDEIKRQIKALYNETARLPKEVAEARVLQVTAEVRALNLVERKRKELQQEVAAGAISSADVDAQIDELKKSLAVSKVPEAKKDLEQKVLDHKLNQAQADDLLKQTVKEDAYLPTTPEEEAYCRRILMEVAKEAPRNATEKWGILGYFGVNSYLESLDDRVRSPFMPYGLSGIIFGASIVFFAYIGFDAVSTHSEEAKKPQRDVPIAILASLVVCTILYICVAAVLTGMLPFSKISPDAAVANTFTKKGLESNNPLLLGASGLISIGALAGMTSVLLISFLSQARIFLAMARDRLLPPAIFAAIHPRFRTPYISTILTGAIIAVVAAITPISKLEEMVNIGTLMAFVIVCAAVMLLRIKRPEAPRPFHCPVIWLVGPLGILVNLLLMLFLPLDTWIRLVVWLVIGLVIYFSYGISRSSVGRQLRGLPPLPEMNGTPADGDVILEKSVMMADPTAFKPSNPNVH
ncbi:MAG TPA: amino acid permease [Gemmataceae bacterium]|nr:amino acid permease [Gemmataceae bacterium]